MQEFQIAFPLHFLGPAAAFRVLVVSVLSLLHVLLVVGLAGPQPENKNASLNMMFPARKILKYPWLKRLITITNIFIHLKVCAIIGYTLLFAWNYSYDYYCLVTTYHPRTQSITISRDLYKKDLSENNCSENAEIFTIAPSAYAYYVRGIKQFTF